MEKKLKTNPSDHVIRLITYVLSIIGLVDGGYLTWVKLAHQKAYCGSSGGCETVATSKYAAIAGIPIALLGAAAYLVILVLLYLENKGKFWKENSPLFIFGITLAGMLYSAYLTYLELAVIKAICPYCVVSAVIITILFILAVIRLFGSQAETG